MANPHLVIVISVTLLWVIGPPSSLCDHVKARNIYKNTEYQNCSFTVQSDVASPCDHSLRQVFRVLTVGDTTMTIGSTECLYTLKEDMTTPRSVNIPLDSAGIASCEFGIPEDQREFRCKNYISYGYENGGPDNFRVCGTFNSSGPICWQCTDQQSSVSCTNGVATAYMPRTPSQNFTIARASDGTQEYFFIGGLKSHTSNHHIFAKVEVSNRVVKSAAVETDENQDQVMYEPQDFVGDPIEHGDFIYFFFRERAKEYDNIGHIIYSRVARVCKSDPGGVTNPLSKQFTTYLKTRLVCSVGTDFPFNFNEIQDVQQADYNSNIVYGLFTTPNAGTSSSAICRYDLDELDTLFNTDTRRGQPTSTQSWQNIDRHAEDQLDRRTCNVPYNNAINQIYSHLESFPLMNTNAPNCGFSTSCSDFTRDSDSALAVYEGVRGQKLAILTDSSRSITAFIGTNDRTILQTRITATEAFITQKIVVPDESIPAFTPKQISDKWPYGVSYLQLHNGAVYGTLDNCAFRFPPNTQPETVSLDIIDRTAQTEYNHSYRIPNAITSVFKLFEAPEGTKMEASFGGVFTEDTCTHKRFTSDTSCREFLQVFCTVSNIDSNRIGNITVKSSSGSTGALSVAVNINIDASERASVSLNEISQYDLEMAKYEYNYRKWLRDDVSCSGGQKSTCPGSSDCCGNC